MVVCFRAYRLSLDRQYGFPVLEHIHLAPLKEQLRLFDRMTNDYTSMVKLQKSLEVIGLGPREASYRFSDAPLMRIAISLAIQLVAAEIWKGARTHSFSMVLTILTKVQPFLEPAIDSLESTAAYRRTTSELNGHGGADLFEGLSERIDLMEPLGVLPAWFYVTSYTHLQQ